jgi:hypothetical protein
MDIMGAMALQGSQSRGDGRMDDATIAKIREVRDHIFWDATILKRMYPWDQDLDVRGSTLSKLIRLLIALHLTARSILDLATASDDVWASLLLPAGANTDKKPYLDVMQLVTINGFVATLFTALESSFRVLFKSLDPVEYHKLEARTGELIRVLLCEKLSRPFAPYYEVVDFLRTLRNTLHNNTIFQPRDGKARSFTFQGSTYTFTPGKRVNFASLELLLDITDCMRSLAFDIARDPKVSAVPFIPDPSRLP